MSRVDMGRGHYTVDAAGLWHYHFDGFGHVSIAVADALGATGPSCYHLPNRPVPAWFWFNGTPAPICRRDDAESLLTRWERWRSAYQAMPSTLLGELHELRGSST